MKRPNILFIQADQLAPHSLAIYGNPASRAPRLDALAGEGVVFDAAHCNFPLCAPSRFSMATGRLCSRVDAFDNAAEMRAEFPTYAHHLRLRGYTTALAGKMHFIGPDQHHGFERRLTPDIYPADFSWAANWEDEGRRDTNDPSSVLVSGVCKSSVQIAFDDEVAAGACGYLRERAAATAPFFLQVSFSHPHEPYLCQRRFWDMYEGVDIPPPAVPPLEEARHDAHSRRILADFGMLDHAFAQEDITRARRAHYGAISYLDEKIGEIVDTLESTGARENTVIIFASDHGEFLGERGMWFKKHFYEPSIRVPLVMSAPWIKPQRVGELVSLVDILPTFNGLADGRVWRDPDDTLEGVDLTGLLGGGRAPPRRTIFAEYLAEAALAPIYMVRRGRYKFIYSSRDPALLFDLDADPNELRNLADEKAHAETLKAFMREVEAKWDDADITARVLDSQRRRRFVKEANRNGTAPRWNHGEAPDQDVPWYRGVQGYNEWALDHEPDTGKRT